MQKHLIFIGLNLSILYFLGFWVLCCSFKGLPYSEVKKSKIPPMVYSVIFRLIFILQSLIHLDFSKV